MELFGIGGMELLLILLITVIVAGPKRMIAWSYTLGKYVATLRRMWSEAAGMIQKELDQAGVDFKVPQEPTRENFAREVSRALTPVTKPVQDSLNEVQKDVNSLRQATNLGAWSGKPPLKSEPGGTSASAPYGAPPPTPPASGNGAAHPAEPPPSEGGFGTWSNPSPPSGG
jgi:Sec-independent protein translocase protein TatA